MKTSSIKLIKTRTGSSVYGGYFSFTAYSIGYLFSNISDNNAGSLSLTAENNSGCSSCTIINKVRIRFKKFLETLGKGYL